MTRRITKEQIDEGVQIDGSQLERMSDAVADRYNNLQLEDLDKKYQHTTVVFTDSNYFFDYTNYFNAKNEPTVVAPNYPLDGRPVLNTYRTKGYNFGSLDPTVIDNYIIQTNSIAFNTPSIIINWSIHIQALEEGEFSPYNNDFLNEGGEVTSDLRFIIQGKNIFEQRDRRFDEVILNNGGFKMDREFFYGFSGIPPISLSSFPIPPGAPEPPPIRGFMVENHLNIPINEQGQVSFLVIIPKVLPFIAGENFLKKFKATHTVTFLEEIK